MKRSKFTDSQIMDALKRVDAGLAVPEVCRQLGISTALSIPKGISFGHYGVPNTVAWTPP
jgi:hypothetical protein